jgi:hypothetical protein
MDLNSARVRGGFRHRRYPCQTLTKSEYGAVGRLWVGDENPRSFTVPDAKTGYAHVLARRLTNATVSTRCWTKTAIIGMNWWRGRRSYNKRSELLTAAQNADFLASYLVCVSSKISNPPPPKKHCARVTRAFLCPFIETKTFWTQNCINLSLCKG